MEIFGLHYRILIFVLIFYSLGVHLNHVNVFAQEKIHTGTIKGRLLDSETKTPLIGANVEILNTIMGAATDEQGLFLIKEVPVGCYNLRFSYIGYQTAIQTDVIVRSQRITFVEAELGQMLIESEAVEVAGGYFTQDYDQPVSISGFSREEIRRAPGSAGDISRILMSLPSIAKINDQSNSLIVRGGSPVENAFYIDNIEIPNINHFPTQGASGGPIGMINVDFIKDVRFHSGGFSSLYGDKLSSIMDITFREGNQDEFDAQVDLNFAGFGGVLETPLFNHKGSLLFSVRRSYLDLLVDMIDVGTSIAPRYGDYQGKLIYDLNPHHRLTVLAISGDSHNNPDRKTAQENAMVVYGNQDIYENTAGVNWRTLWNKYGYSNTSISYTSGKFKEDFYETSNADHLLRSRSFEQNLKMRNVNHLRLSEHNSIEFGVETKHIIMDYDNFYNEYSDALGNTVPAFTIDKRITANKIGAFANYIAKSIKHLTVILGVRADYFSYNENSYLSPRFSFSYQLTPRTTLNGASGMFYQNLPLLLLSQHESNRNLNDPMAIHYIIGVDHLFTENTKFTMEIYEKDYQNFPIDPNQPSLFLLDELFYRYGFFFNHAPLLDDGKAYSRGIEIIVQKRLAKDIYGLASVSYFRTKYKGGDNIWRERIFDNRLIFSVEGGYKPNNKWEFSLRWIYAGGAPYTPFDIEESRQLNRAVLDKDRINKARYPDYHSLNVRFDRRFHFSSSNLVFYLSVWNAYNHKNVASYYWNAKENDQDVIYQWNLLPIFGLEFEF
jgi:hypothetical protein